MGYLFRKNISNSSKRHYPKSLNYYENLYELKQTRINSFIQVLIELLLMGIKVSESSG